MNTWLLILVTIAMVGFMVWLGQYSKLLRVVLPGAKETVNVGPAIQFDLIKHQGEAVLAQVRGTEMERRLRLALWVDYGFMVVYAMFFAGWIARIGGGWGGMAPSSFGSFFKWLGQAAWWLACAAAGLDAIENAMSFVALARSGAVVQIASGFALAKWAMIALLMISMVVGGLGLLVRKWGGG